MSIPFSDTTNKNGILQQIERAVDFNDGDITDDTTLLAQFTADVNLAVDEVTALILSVDKSRQIDDYNHSKYPIITMDLTDGQRDYTFTADEQSNLIVHIHKVMCADSSGKLRTIDRVDQQEHSTDQDTFNDGQDTEGTPIKYDLTADGLFLDPIPSYSVTAGLKVFIDREASHFLTSDTDKVAGFLSLFHEYLVLKPAYRYARDKGLPNRNDLKRDMFEMRQYMEEHILRNQNATPQRLGAAYQNNR